jgi:phosphohistidine phosphatase SixA|tara:strand:- start:71 stop:823 length:753 start_codon:yes stop_codon:yes gene_type:complete
MIKQASCVAALLLMAACSSGSVSDDSASKQQPTADSSEVEAYEQNDTTLSGEQNNKEFVNKLDDEALASALRDGGHVIYIRHAKTNKDWGDQVSPELDLSDCSTQRRLSDEGKADAKQIGEGIKAAGIPVGDVISSDYCRAYNTADLAFGTYTKNSNLNFLPCVECTPKDYEEYAARVSPLLSAKPEAGKNTFLVGHDDPFQGVTMPVIPENGIYPAPMGVAYVAKPLGDGKFDLVAKILPNQWQTLAQN